MQTLTLVQSATTLESRKPVLTINRNVDSDITSFSADGTVNPAISGGIVSPAGYVQFVPTAVISNAAGIDTLLGGFNSNTMNLKSLEMQLEHGDITITAYSCIINENGVPVMTSVWTSAEPLSSLPSVTQPNEHSAIISISTDITSGTIKSATAEETLPAGAFLVVWRYSNVARGFAVVERIKRLLDNC